LDIGTILRTEHSEENCVPVFVKRRGPFGKRVACVGFTREGSFLVLRYAVVRENEKCEVQLPLSFQTTRLHSGGARWWFTCPLVAYGVPVGVGWGSSTCLLEASTLGVGIAMI
jgi:hypothetical protein